MRGKGEGLAAHFDVTKSERILCEKRLLSTANLSPLSYMKDNIAIKLRALAKLNNDTLGTVGTVE